MSNPTELNGKTEDGYTPLVDLEDDGDEEFDDGYIPPNIHPFRRFLLRGNLCSNVFVTLDDTRNVQFLLFYCYRWQYYANFSYNYATN